MKSDYMTFLILIVLFCNDVDVIRIGEGRYDQEKKYPIKSNQKNRYKENNSKRIINKYIKFNNKSLTLKNIPPPDQKSN